MIGPRGTRPHAMRHVGIDFGTTNSAVSIVEGDARPELVSFPGLDGAMEPLWRTVLYFDPHHETGEQLSAGGPAIVRYLENEGEGRLLQSIKSHLASRTFSGSQILGRRYTIEGLIGAYLRKVREASPVDLGTRAVVGRPVRYWGAESDEDDQRAVGRMREALRLAGFDDVILEYEPVAAAARYASELDHEELVLIADFGGGTSDFTLVRVGPKIEPGAADAILATGGVAIGGDAFDGRLIDRLISPPLGKGSSYLVEMGAEAPVPGWIYTRLRRWHHLSFLKNPKTMALLQRVQRGALAKAAIDQLVEIITYDLGLRMHKAVEATKLALSREEAASLRFVHDDVNIAASVLRERFDEWIEPELAQIHAVIDDLLERTGTAPREVDRVFATGGSSLVPAVRQALGDRFGSEKLVGGRELTSVAWGLAIRARALQH